MLDLKLSSVLYLVDGTYKWFDPAYAEDLWGLVHKAKLKLARKVDDAFTEGIVDSDYVVESDRQLKQVEEWLETHTPTAPSMRTSRLVGLKQKFENFTADLITWVKSKVFVSPQRPLEEVYSGSVAVEPPANDYLVVDAIMAHQIKDDPREVIAKLTRAADLATQFWTAGHSDAPLSVALNDYIVKLPMEMEFWHSAAATDPDGINAIARQLRRLGAVSFKTSYLKGSQTAVHPQMVFSQEKLKMLFHMLGEIGNPVYKNMSVDSIFRFNEEGITDYQLYRQPYIQQKDARHVSNSVVDTFFTMNSNMLNFIIAVSDIAEFVLKNDPALYERLNAQLQQTNANVANGEAKIKSAYFLVSDVLPDWMVGLRDTGVYSQWLYSGRLPKLEVLDRSRDLECQYILSPAQDSISTSIDINLHGLRNDMPLYVRPSMYWRTNMGDSDIERVINRGMRGSRYTYEKPVLEVFDSHIKIKSLTPEEQLELRQLFIDTAIRPWRLLGYFLKYPSKLNETEYQVLFKYLLFQKATYDLLSNPDSLFSGRLQEFLRNQLEMAFREGEIATCVFLNQITGILETHEPQSQLYNRTYERFAGLLHKPGLSVEEKKRIYLGLTEYVYNHERPTDDQLLYVLKGLMELSNDNELQLRMDPEMLKCRDDFSFKYFSNIQAFLGLPGALNQNLLYEIVKDRLPERQVWYTRQTASGIELISQNGQFIYRPCTGVLKGVRESQTLPRNILENPQFQSVFPNPLQHIKVKNNVYKVWTAEGGVYYIALGTNDRIAIQKKGADDNSWERYCNLGFVFANNRISPDAFRRGTPVHGKFFEKGYQGWIESTNPNIINFREAGKPDAPFAPYHLDTRTGAVHDIDRQLVLSKPSALLSRFEDSEYIHEWYSVRPSQLSVLELPRYQLAFTRNQDNPPPYESREFPGYYLRPNQRVPALGIYQEYLLLENDEGKQKILLPHVNDKKVDQHESLAPLYAFDFNSNVNEKQQRNFYSYDIDPEGFPVGKTLESNLWLAKTFALVQKHRHAARILRASGEKITSYTDAERDVLNKILGLSGFNGDESGESIGITLYARYLLTRNKQLTEKLDANDIHPLCKVYNEYLSRLKNVTALPLKKHEELHLCRLLLGYGDVIGEGAIRTLETRLQLLESGTIVDATVRSHNMNVLASSGKEPERFRGFDTREQLVDSARSPYLLTRAGPHIQHHFSYFHTLAAGAPCRERARLETACKFMLANARYQLMAQYLLYLMDHPEFYSQPDDWRQDRWATAKARATVLQEQQQLLQIAQIKPAYPKGRTVTKSVAASTSEPIPFSFTAVKEPTVIDGAQAYFQKEPSVTGVVESFMGWLSSVTGLNPLEKREYDRLIEDCHAVSAKEKFTIADESLDALEIRLGENREENRERMSQLKRSILKKARRRFDDPQLAARQRIRTKGGAKKVELEDVFISFARKNTAVLAEKNQALEAHDLQQIHTETAEYLQLVTWEQQRGRALREIRKIRRAEGERKRALVQSLRTIICTERAYSVQENPALLVFEFYSQKLLWEKQIKALQLFLERKGENPVMELIMGSGKSEVLLPLLALLRADGECISMIIAPQTLFENVSSNTHKINKEAFGQSLHAIHFDRNTELSKARLESILQELHHIRDHKEALVVTSKTIQCIILKFMEQSFKHYSGDVEGKTPPVTLTLLGEIVQLLSTQGYPIVDEADSIMRIMHETSFNLGERITPNLHEIEFVRTIYQMILELQKQTPVLTQEVYEEKWKPYLQQQIMLLFRSAREGSFGLNASEAACLRNLPYDDLRDYLCRKTERKTELDKWFAAIPEKKVRDLVSLAAEETTHLLSFTLLKEWNVAYGRDRSQKSPIPVPFEFAAVPKSGSVFANPYITKNYAFQTYMKEGIDVGLVTHQIKRLQDEATNEMRLLGIADYTQTKAWREFCILKGDVDVPFLRMTPDQIKYLVSEINGSQKHLLTYITYFILPQLVLYSHKLTCSPINMISLFRWFSGFTGTLWNSKSMYHTTAAHPEIGTDAKTLSILWQTCNSEDAVVMVRNESSQGLLQELHQTPHEVLIDGGGYLKELSNGAVAEKMSELSGAPTVFYNPKGEKTVLEATGEIPLSESRLKLHQRRTYLDHSHTIGANVLQFFNALGLVTIGKGILLRDLLQFVWRMRGLEDLQKVKFVVSFEVAMLIRKALGLPDDTPIRFVHILAYAIKNQAEQQGRDNHKAFAGQLWNVPQQLLLRVLFCDMLTEQQKKVAYDKLEQVWIKLVSTCASDSFGIIPIEIDAAEDVTMMMNKATRYLHECFDECPFLELVRPRHECLMDFEAIKNQIKVGEAEPVASSSSAVTPAERYLLPPKASSPEHPQDETVDLELDLDTDTQRELETVQVDAGDEWLKLGCMQGMRLIKVASMNEIVLQKHQSSISRPHGYVIPLNVILRDKPELRKFSHLFDDIDFGMNMLQWRQGQENLDNYSVFGIQRTPPAYINLGAYMREGGVDQSTMVYSDSDNGYEINNLRPYAYDINCGFRSSRSSPLTPDKLERLVKIKFFFGEVGYTKAEQQILERWIEQAGRELLKELFEKHALAGFPLKAERYHGSWLQKKLQE
jgi:hypothetical protein